MFWPWGAPRCCVLFIYTTCVDTNPLLQSDSYGESQHEGTRRLNYLSFPLPYHASCDHTLYSILPCSCWLIISTIHPEQFRTRRRDALFVGAFFRRGPSENYRPISISVAHRSTAGRTRPRLRRSRRKHKSLAWKVVNPPFRFKVPPRSISVLSIGTLVSHTRKRQAGYLSAN